MVSIDSEGRSVGEHELIVEEIGNIASRVEERIGGNEPVFLTSEEAEYLLESTSVNFRVFSEGWVDRSKPERPLEVKPSDAETGQVLGGRARLVQGAVGDELFVEMLSKSLGKAMTVKGGKVGEQEGFDPLIYAKEFVRGSMDGGKFSFLDGEKTDAEKDTIYRLVATINAVYYVLAVASLVGSEAFEGVQRDLLLSANMRLPILKGIERAKDNSDRLKVPGFAQAAPIRHLPPGCLAEALMVLTRE